VTDMMRQVVFTECERAELLSVPAGAPGPDEVAGRTLTSVISAGTELGMQYTATDGFPHEPGYGAVFEIDAVGSNIADVRPGDHVFCIGKHASRQCTAREDVVPVPSGLAPEVAVLTRMVAISYRSLVRTRVRPPARALVTGLGAVGHFAARLFADAGYTVCAVDPNAGRRDMLGTFLQCDMFERTPLGNPDWQDRVDIILECSGLEQVVYEACCIARKQAEIIVVGVPWKDSDFPASGILYKVFWRHLSLTSGYEWDLPWTPTASEPESYSGNCAAILDRLQNGSLPVDGLYATVTPNNCQRVYQAILEGHSPALCTVFDWRVAQEPA